MPDHGEFSDRLLDRPVEFTSSRNRRLRLAQGTAYRRSFPDIRIQCGQRVLAVAEVKIKASKDTYRDAASQLRTYLDADADVKALLVAFWVPPKSSIRSYFRDVEAGLARESSWLTTIILEGDSRTLGSVLSESLGLDRVRALIQSGD